MGVESGSNVFRFAPCPACCGAECLYFEDDFGRPDSTILGDDWTEVVGNWQITSSELKITTANALVRCEVEHPSGESALIVTGQLRGDTAGDKFRIYVNFSDSLNYEVVEIVLSTSPTFGTVSLITRGGGAESIILTAQSTIFIEDVDIPWRICITAARLTFAGGASNQSVVSMDATAISDVVYLGTGDTMVGNAFFDNFTLNQHQSTNVECETCLTCTHCEDEVLPDAIRITVVGLEDDDCTDCDNLNGVYDVPIVALCKYEILYDPPLDCNLTRITARILGGAQKGMDIAFYDDTGPGFEVIADWGDTTLGVELLDCTETREFRFLGGVVDYQCDPTPAGCTATWEAL